MNPASRQPAEGARSALALLLAINLFNYLDRYILAAVEPRVSEDLLRGDPHALAKMGSLATAFMVSYMITAPIFGWLADRMSRWLLVAIGVTIWTLASGGSGLAATFALLLITRLFVGIGEAGYGPAAPTIIADLFPLERRGQVLSWFYIAIPVGSALGYLWGGVIASWFSWRWAFYTVVPPGMILAALSFTRKDPRAPAPLPVIGERLGEGSSPLDAHAERPFSSVLSQGTGRGSEYRSLIRNRSYLLDCAGMTAMTFAIGGISFWMPHYIAEFRNAGSLARVNTIFGGLTAIGGIAATLLGGIVGDKLRPRFAGSYFLVSGVGILLACPFVIAMLYVPFPAAWGLIFLAVFFLFFNTGPTNTILANVTPPGIRATAFAINIFLIHAIGDALSPPVLGAIVGKNGRWNLAFFLVAATMALAAVLWMWGARYLADDTAAVESLGQPPGDSVAVAAAIDNNPL